MRKTFTLKKETDRNSTNGGDELWLHVQMIGGSLTHVLYYLTTCWV